MITIKKHFRLAVQHQFGKELDSILYEIDFDSYITRRKYYEEEIMGHTVGRYCVDILCDEEHEKYLINKLNMFNHNVTIIY